MKKTGVELIAIERKEQIEKHGITIEKDVAENNVAQLSFASALLSCPNPKAMGYNPNLDTGRPEKWDKNIWHKMMAKPYKERLIIAGALICAEIDRLQAIEEKK